MTKTSSIKILLAADVHLGHGVHSRHSPEVRQRLAEERIKSLQRAVQLANDHEAHFIVIAGDLFHRTKVEQTLVNRAVEALNGFQGKDDDGVVLILPGNHDFCAAGGSELWRAFQSRVDEVRAGDRVTLLLHSEPYSRVTGDMIVEFFPCPCGSKHSESHAIGWVRDSAKTLGALHIGIAHGNVDGLGLDAEGRYFNMSREELAASGVHCWLLGHIHVPSPDPSTVGASLLYMPGTTTPDDATCRSPGCAWLLEFEGVGCVSHKLLQTGRIRFERLSGEMREESDLDMLMKKVESIEGSGDVVLELRISGTLPQECQARIGPWIDRIRGRFIDVRHEAVLVEQLDAVAIDRNFVAGTFKHRLLSALLASGAPPGDLHRACDAFQEALRT